MWCTCQETFIGTSCTFTFKLTALAVLTHQTDIKQQLILKANNDGVVLVNITIKNGVGEC